MLYNIKDISGDKHMNVFLNLLSDVADKKPTTADGGAILPYEWLTFVLIGVIAVAVTIYCIIKTAISRRKKNKK
jgi:hypothetical protein